MLTEWILASVAVLTLISSVVSWLTRQQMQINKLEMDSRLTSMELRLTEKIGGMYATWQAHNDLSARVTTLSDRLDFVRDKH